MGDVIPLAREQKEERESLIFSTFALLMDCRWHNWREAKMTGKEFNARISELENLGFVILRRWEKNPPPGAKKGGKDYRLKSLIPGPPKPPRGKLHIYDTSLEPALDLLVVVHEAVMEGRTVIRVDPSWDQPDVRKAFRKAANTPREAPKKKTRDALLTMAGITLDEDEDPWIDY